MPVSRVQLARMIEHTQLRAYASQVDIAELCDEAMQQGFHAVAVNPAWAPFCVKKLAGSGVGICVTVGFPLGSNTAQIKVEEARDAARNGATELDMVINIGALKSGYPGYVEREIAALVKAVRGLPVKVILETSYLSRDEKVAVCEMSMRAGAAFVKTATGYGHGGATPEDVALMKKVVGDQLGIKAAGGIRTYGDAVALIEAGATRIGTSAGVEILEGAPE
ncbi:MAG: deoxyribose-phosphate aldolase [Candidatus Hydrogenedentes bacterium]|nr:deoxyribose-phosphate aldolase [Candidatus Hydrogenedentota bacterium]